MKSKTYTRRKNELNSSNNKFNKNNPPNKLNKLSLDHHCWINNLQIQIKTPRSQCTDLEPQKNASKKLRLWKLKWKSIYFKTMSM